MTTQTPSLISIKEAAQQLNLSERTVRRMITRGDLAARRIGTRTIRIPVEAVASVGYIVPTYRRRTA